MSYEATVFNDTLIQVWCLEFLQPGELDLNDKLKEFAKAQAKHTWDAAKQEGRRDVVEVLEKHNVCQAKGLFNRPVPLEDCVWWQVQQKKWGL